MISTFPPSTLKYFLFVLHLKFDNDKATGHSVMNTKNRNRISEHRLPPLLLYPLEYLSETASLFVITHMLAGSLPFCLLSFVCYLLALFVSAKQHLAYFPSGRCKRLSVALRRDHVDGYAG